MQIGGQEYGAIFFEKMGFADNQLLNRAKCAIYVPKMCHCEKVKSKN